MDKINGFVNQISSFITSWQTKWLIAVHIKEKLGGLDE
jgi:hypothetical protein